MKAFGAARKCWKLGTILEVPFSVGFWPNQSGCRLLLRRFFKGNKKYLIANHIGNIGYRGVLLHSAEILQEKYLRCIHNEFALEIFL